MILGTDVVDSPAWWLDRLAKRLMFEPRQRRLRELRAWHRGEPPLPEGAERARESYRAFQRLARSNFAGLVVDAVRQRTVPVGIRSGADGSAEDDVQAWDTWTRAGMDVHSADVHRTALSLGDAYVTVGDIDPETAVPTITPEDPLQAVTEQDPAIPWRTLAGLKMYHDSINGLDRAYLYLPGKVFTASKPNPIPVGRIGRIPISYDPASWSWDGPNGGEQVLPPALSQSVCMVRFSNEDSRGEFEGHLDLLGRINHTILQRMAISTMQAFRQRAAMGLPTYYPPGHPQAGQEIDYSEIMISDPGIMWQLPETAKIWESGQVDLTPILSSIKDDLAHLSAVTSVPLHMLTPDGANQSAQGASLAREGIVFKAKDRGVRFSWPWARVMSLAARWQGDEARATTSPAQIVWMAPECYSLTERAAAAGTAVDVPWETKMQTIWGYSPDQVERMKAQREEDQLLAIAQAKATGGAPAQSFTPTVPNLGGAAAEQ